MFIYYSQDYSTVVNTRNVMDSNPSRGNEIFNILISMESAMLSSATPEFGERMDCLTLGSQVLSTYLGMCRNSTA